MTPGRLRRVSCIAAVLSGVAGPLLAQGNATRGERVFQRCFSCHSVDPAERSLPGPNLAGVVGRRAGSLADFEYSPAMVAAGRQGLIWTAETLDRFLAAPEAVVPGTPMAPPPGLSAPDDRAAVIAYLRRFGAP